MGGAARLRQAVAAGAGEREADRARKVDAMARGHEHRLHAAPRAHGGSDHLPPVHERRPRPAFRRRPGEVAQQPRLGDADLGHVERPAQVGGEAEATRMGESPGRRRSAGRARSAAPPGHRARPGSCETTAGRARKRSRTPRQAGLRQSQVALPQHRNRGPRHAAAILEADVDAGDQTDRTRAIAQLGLARQAVLEGARGGRGRVPGVLVDRPQRHGRRSRASLMMRTVSDHRPRVSICSSVNQRASAASLPGRSAGPVASAVKSTRV